MTSRPSAARTCRFLFLDEGAPLSCDDNPRPTRDAPGDLLARRLVDCPQLRDRRHRPGGSARVSAPGFLWGLEEPGGHPEGAGAGAGAAPRPRRLQTRRAIARRTLG